MARRCFVCGFESRAAVCPRCNTILRADQAVGRTCGKAFDGWVATCDACGGFTVGQGEGPGDREAGSTTSSVPGRSSSRPKQLVAPRVLGCPDVVGLALRESAIRVR